jgi:UDPglucose 6-dehydrogenase/GDP-mannose 6-dehydrogenase
MKVSIIGTGYVGLVSGVCLAEKGHQVICVDTDREKVNKINRGIAPFYEEGLEPLLRKNLHVNLQAISDLQKAIIKTEISLIAVGTPYDGDNIDLTYIKEVSKQIGTALREKSDYHTVVVKSTVVPGTTDNVVLPILEDSSGRKSGAEFGVGMNPEFLREGVAVEDFMFPDRIIFGGIDQKSIDALDQLYGAFKETEKVQTNNKTAEMIKYTSNSLLAMMISFSNEIANLCAAIGGIDVVDVMKGVHLDKRLTPIMADGKRLVPSFTTYLEAGCGFGGSCFPKDLKALISHGKSIGQPMDLLEAVVEVNNCQPDQMLGLLKKHFNSFKDKRISVLGLAFKPGTDDMRESPAIPVVTGLLSQKAQIKAYDPVASDEARKIFGNNNITYCEDLKEAVKDVEAIVIITRWEHFKDIPDILDELNQSPVVIDGRRMLEKSTVEQYEGIGL